jgi:hypothetical protein
MDQREAVRVPVRVRARCRVQGIVIDGLVEDVSRSGLFMRAWRVVDEGAALELDLDLPGEDTIHLHATVVRVQREPRIGFALKFVGNQEPHRRWLANFIMRQHATSR